MKLWPMPMKSLILFMLLNPSLSNYIIMRKSYDQSIQLNCPGCDSNECPIIINGVNTTAAAAPGYHIHNSQLIVPSHNWNGYGMSCCGELDQRSCYTICPQYTEICKDCLRISANATTIAVGNIITVNCSMNQQPHSGITLFINGIASTDPSADLRCSTESIWGHLVTYYCIAKKSGMMNITANTEFCDTVVDSQQIYIIIEEKRIDNKTEDHHESSMFTPLDANISANNASHIIPMTTKTVETTLTSTTMSSTKASTAVIFNGITSIMMHSSSTTASGTNNREETNQSMRTVLIIVIVVILSLILLVITVILGVIFYRIKISNAKQKQHGPPALEQQMEHRPPVMVEDF